MICIKRNHSSLLNIIQEFVSFEGFWWHVPRQLCSKVIRLSWLSAVNRGTLLPFCAILDSFHFSLRDCHTRNDCLHRARVTSIVLASTFPDTSRVRCQGRRLIRSICSSSWQLLFDPWVSRGLSLNLSLPRQAEYANWPERMLSGRLPANALTFRISKYGGKKLELYKVIVACCKFDTFPA